MDSFFHLKLHVYTTNVAIVNQILQKHILNEGIINAFVMSCSSLLKNMKVLHSQKHSIFFSLLFINN